MPYLLSLLGSDAMIAGSQQYLCCYSNDTVHLQIIRAFQAQECLFSRVVFPNERVLFTALPESALEICAPLSESTRLRRVDCQRLYLHAGLKAAPVVAVADTAPAAVAAAVV